MMIIKKNNNKTTINTTMKEIEKKHYEAPQLTVVTFKAERGYAQSNPKRLLQSIVLSSALSGHDSQRLDDRGSVDSWSW